MFEPFIPHSAQKLQNQDAIHLLDRLHRHPITLPEAMHGDFPATVPTALVRPQQNSRPEQDSPTESAPLLLLHGFDSSLLEFRHLIPQLTSHRAVYAMDLLGFGFTALPPSVPIEPDTIRQHLYYTWKTLIDRPVILVGASMGGAVGIDFALNHPDCVERLILINSVGFSGSFPFGKLLTTPVIEWGTDWLHFRKDTSFRVLEALPFVSADQQDLVLCSSLHQEMPGWKQAVISFTKSGGYSYLKPRIADLQQPTLILWGDRDKTLGTQDARKFEQTIPHSQLVWIKGADHAPHIFEPAAIAQAILNWL